MGHTVIADQKHTVDEQQKDYNGEDLPVNCAFDFFGCQSHFAEENHQELLRSYNEDTNVECVESCKEQQFCDASLIGEKVNGVTIKVIACKINFIYQLFHSIHL